MSRAMLSDDERYRPGARSAIKTSTRLTVPVGAINKADRQDRLATLVAGTNWTMTRSSSV
jgi:hypothetical protein